MMRQIAIPVVIGGWVVVAGLTLIGIVIFGPYTHNNMAQRYDPAYSRTEQALVGKVVPLTVSGVPGLESSTDQIARGRTLMIVDNCAGCHGLDGRGGIIGKPIVGFTADELRAKIVKGPGEMPAFAPAKFASGDIEAIAAYLTSLKQNAN